MEYRKLHSWRLTPTEAVALQRQLAGELRLEPLKRKVRLIAGADISFNLYSNTVYAAFVVLDARTLEIKARASAVSEAPFPYIPGLLTFREAPPLLAAWKKLTVKPDVVVFDGQGIAHPRRMGIAAHMGLLIDLPSIGCGKSLLCGSYGELGEAKGAIAPLLYKKEKVGVALRTKDHVNPVFISPGHRIDLESAWRVVLATARGYRIPEPTRQAHLLVNELRRAANAA